MIAHAWTVVCEKSITDRETNNLSLDVLEEISFVEIPREPGTAVQVPMQVSIVSLWYRTVPEQPTQAQTRITYLGPDATPIARAIAPLDLSVYERQRSFATFPTLPVTTEGRYFFCVELFDNEEWREVARVPLRINILPGESPTAS